MHGGAASIAGKVPIGPWTVIRRPLAVLAAGDGKTHLSLEGGKQSWVGEGELWKKWEGTEAEALDLAETYGGMAAPKRWEAKAMTNDEGRMTNEAAAPKARAHRHDRTGEELEEV